MTTLNRTTFETSRDAEYFNKKELQVQTGQTSEMFASVALKELLDNALDACEAAGVTPEIIISTANGNDRIRLSVEDNGKGIEPETVERILNFQTRTSDKSVYRSPTRGAQGNALKTIIGMPHALGSAEPVKIEAQGVCHTVKALVDPAGELRIEHNKESRSTVPGTKVELTLPVENQNFKPDQWAKGFSLFNPHVLIKNSHFDDNGGKSKHAKSETSENTKTSNSYHSTVKYPGNWRKFLPTDLTSPWWYSQTDLKTLVFSHIAESRRNGNGGLTLRDFVRQFKGLSGVTKAKGVCDQFPEVKRLNDFESISEARVNDLLQAMRNNTNAPSPGILGLVGEKHFKSCFDQWYGVKRFWYRKIAKEVFGIPFICEAALAETEQTGRIFTGVNFSPTYGDPIGNTQLHYKKTYAYGIYNLLNNTYVSPEPDEYYYYPASTAFAFHLTCPMLEFLDRGKTRLKISEGMANEIAKVLWSVVKKMCQEEERRQKDAAREGRREREKSLYIENLIKYTQKEAVFEVLPEALRKATGNGKYPVSARNLFYQVRPLMAKHTNKELGYTYFSQTLLTEYQELNGPIQGLYYDPRGILYEPHTGKSVPLGTREVEQYSFPTWLYNKILYVEKKGLWPILEAAKLAERYDMAVVAAEGYANEAVRLLFQHAEQDENYQLFVLHDADPHGYNIARTLREETRRMPGYEVETIDLGLYLEDALDLGLETETFTRKKALPYGLELTEKEIEYFEGTQSTRTSWICERVELNALSAPQLIEYIEKKLSEAGAIGKVIPPTKDLEELTASLYEDAVSLWVRDAIERIFSVDAISDQIAEEFQDRFSLGDVSKWIKQAFDRDDSLSWDAAVKGKLDSLVREHAGDLEKTLKVEINGKEENERHI